MFLLSCACVIGVVLLSDYAFRNHPGAVVAVWAVVILGCIFFAMNRVIWELRTYVMVEVAAANSWSAVAKKFNLAEICSGPWAGLNRMREQDQRMHETMLDALRKSGGL